MRVLLDHRDAISRGDGVCQAIRCVVAGKGGPDHDDFTGMRDHAIGETVQERRDREAHTRDQLVKGEADEPREKEGVGQHCGVLQSMLFSQEISIDSTILSDPMSAARLPDRVMDGTIDDYRR